MIYRRCGICGKRIAVGTKCECSKKRYKEEDKDKKQSKEKKFYSSAAWQKVRSKAISQCNGLDVYSYYVFRRIEPGQTVHHIEPVKTCWDKRYDVDNLIYLTEANHQLIHKMMGEGSGKTKEIVLLLRELVFRFRQEIGK